MGYIVTVLETGDVLECTVNYRRIFNEAFEEGYSWKNKLNGVSTYDVGEETFKALRNMFMYKHIIQKGESEEAYKEATIFLCRLLILCEDNRKRTVSIQ